MEKCRDYDSDYFGGISGKIDGGKVPKEISGRISIFREAFLMKSLEAFLEDSVEPYFNWF